MQITDGTGSGSSAKVTSDNRIMASCLDEQLYQAIENETAYVWTASANLADDKNVIWLRNDSSTKLVIHSVQISCSAAATVELWKGSGSTSGGTAVTGINMYLSSSESADVTCTHTNTNVDAGSGMTIFGTLQCPATHPLYVFGGMVLGLDDEIAVNVVTDIDLTSIQIIGYFRSDV